MGNTNSVIKFAGIRASNGKYLRVHPTRSILTADGGSSPLSVWRVWATQNLDAFYVQHKSSSMFLTVEPDGTPKLEESSHAVMLIPIEGTTAFTMANTAHGTPLVVDGESLFEFIQLQSESDALPAADVASPKWLFTAPQHAPNDASENNTEEEAVLPDVPDAPARPLYDEPAPSEAASPASPKAASPTPAPAPTPVAAPSAPPALRAPETADVPAAPPAPSAEAPASASGIPELPPLFASLASLASSQFAAAQRAATVAADGVTCPKGHTMVRGGFVAWPFTCDRCDSASSPDLQHARCVDCNYDVCRRCEAKPAESATPVAADVKPEAKPEAKATHSAQTAGASAKAAEDMAAAAAATAKYVTDALHAAGPGLASIFSAVQNAASTAGGVTPAASGAAPVGGAAPAGGTSASNVPLAQLLSVLGSLNPSTLASLASLLGSGSNLNLAHLPVLLNLAGGNARSLSALATLAGFGGLGSRPPTTDEHTKHSQTEDQVTPSMAQFLAALPSLAGVFSLPAFARAAQPPAHPQAGGAASSASSDEAGALPASVTTTLRSLAQTLAPTLEKAASDPSLPPALREPAVAAAAAAAAVAAGEPADLRAVMESFAAAARTTASAAAATAASAASTAAAAASAAAAAARETVAQRQIDAQHPQHDSSAECPAPAVMPQPDGPPLRCPQGHAMVRMCPRGVWVCDSCGVRSPRDGRDRCQECDFDLCASCGTKARELFAAAMASGKQ